MKAYTLLIDPSASSPASESLYVYEADTVEDAIDKLNELDLEFETGKVYCATIGRRIEGKENRYCTTLRTDNGEKWFREKDDRPYIPETWARLEDWENLKVFRKDFTPQRHYVYGLGVNVRNELKAEGFRFDPKRGQWFHEDPEVAKKAEDIINKDQERFEEIKNRIMNGNSILNDNNNHHPVIIVDAQVVDNKNKEIVGCETTRGSIALRQ